MTTAKNNKAPDPQPAERANASVVEQIAQQWDGCQYDAPGEMVDIGSAIRRAGKRLSAELAEHQNAALLDALADLASWRELADHVRTGVPIWPGRYTDASTRDVAVFIRLHQAAQQAGEVQGDALCTELLVHADGLESMAAGDRETGESIEQAIEDGEGYTPDEPQDIAAGLQHDADRAEHTAALLLKAAAALAALAARQLVAQEPAAWVHEEDSARVISARQKATALRDQGASRSSVRPYSVPAFLKIEPAQGMNLGAGIKDHEKGSQP